ncbi:MAG: relaxase/mobilization nuclease domain-containing protein [Gloeobacterales cyanobacterium]
MTGKQSRGISFSGVLNYAFQKHKQPEIVGGTMLGNSLKELAEEFDKSQHLCSHSRVQKPVYHLAISFRQGEEISNNQMSEMAEQFLKRMGWDLDKTQAVFVRHYDTKHSHIHVIANQVMLDGRTVNLQNNWERGKAICRELEAEYSLEKTSNIKPLIRGLQKEEREMMQHGKPSTKHILQNTIIDLASNFRTAESFFTQLERKGVGISVYESPEGEVKGISYRIENHAMRGSSLGKAFSWSGLQKYLGVNYEPSRDRNIILRASRQESGGYAITENRQLEKTDGRADLVPSETIPRGEQQSTSTADRNGFRTNEVRSGKATFRTQTNAECPEISIGSDDKVPRGAFRTECRDSVHAESLANLERLVGELQRAAGTDRAGSEHNPRSTPKRIADADRGYQQPSQHTGNPDKRTPEARGRESGSENVGPLDRADQPSEPGYTELSRTKYSEVVQGKNGSQQDFGAINLQPDRADLQARESGDLLEVDIQAVAPRPGVYSDVPFNQSSGAAISVDLSPSEDTDQQPERPPGPNRESSEPQVDRVRALFERFEKQARKRLGREPSDIEIAQAALKKKISRSLILKILAQSPKAQVQTNSEKYFANILASAQRQMNQLEP